MSDNEDWVMRPWLAGLVSYTELLSGRVQLLDVGRMNEALDVRAENMRRMAEKQ